MHTVIKGTQTIEEYKKWKGYLEEKAPEAYSQHKAMYEEWPHGEPVETRIYKGEMDDFVEITYQSGAIYHYRWTEDGQMLWW